MSSRTAGSALTPYEESLHKLATTAQGIVKELYGSGTHAFEAKGDGKNEVIQGVTFHDFRPKTQLAPSISGESKS